MPSKINAYSVLIRQLETVSRLDEEDRVALRKLPLRTRLIEENRDLFREGQTSRECSLILSGLAYRYKIVSGGRRQIVSFHFAGDMPDLQSLYLDRMDHSLGVLTNAEVAFISHTDVRALADERPSLAAAFHRQSLIDASIFREWIANVGRRFARERVSHLICECFERMHAVGLAEPGQFNLPITQNEMGDATGLSNVHINRTLQDLRKSGLITSSGKTHRVPDWVKLREAADFDAAYLHLLPPLP